MLAARNWTKDIWQAFAQPTYSRAAIDQSRRLRSEKLPRSLFKYRPPTELALENLKNLQLWFSSAAKVNDPLDTVFTVQTDPLYDCPMPFEACEGLFAQSVTDLLSESQADALRNPNLSLRTLGSILWSHKTTQSERIVIEGALRASYREVTSAFMHLIVIDVQAKYQICCFTERIESVAMWAHYTDGHKGFTIEFDSEVLALAGETDMIWPVYYSETMFDATECIAQVYKDKKKFNPLFGIAASTCKSAEWSYENEWRSIIPLGNGESGHLRTFPQPKGIYLGLAIDSKIEGQIASIAQDLRIPVYRMKPQQSSYALRFEKVS